MLPVIAWLTQIWDIFLPINRIWHVLLADPMAAVLNWLTGILSNNVVAHDVGAFGVAIILLTIVIKVILAPVFQYQLSTSRKVQAQQRKLAPELAALRKKHKKDPQALNQATMALYKEHNINPLAQASGCLPALLQAPILIALYRVIYNAQSSLHLHAHDTHFLWITHLTDKAGAPSQLLILPLLAAATTYVQTKMMTPKGGAVGADPTQAQMTQTMAIMMPAFIGFISLSFPAALALYWVVSNLFSIGQQYFITGWGSLAVPWAGKGEKGDSYDQRGSNRKDSRRGDRESIRGAGGGS